MQHRHYYCYFGFAAVAVAVAVSISSPFLRAPCSLLLPPLASELPSSPSFSFHRCFVFDFQSHHSSSSFVSTNQWKQGPGRQQRESSIDALFLQDWKAKNMLTY